jgi:outer membrane protein, heavy metal efflux system
MNRGHRSKMAFALVSFMALLSGCTSLDARPAFKEVQKSAKLKTGHTVRWHQSAEEDALVAAEIQKMLVSDLTADQAVQIALLNNRRLQATYERLHIAQANLVQAGLLKNPVFHAELRFLEGTPAGKDPILEMAVAQSFLDILMIPLRKRLARTQLEAVKADVTSLIMDLSARVKIAFYAFQASAQTLRMQREILAATEASFEMASRLHKAGNITDLSLANERALYEQSKLAVASAELSMAEAGERMNSLMGLWGKETQWNVVPHLPGIPQNPIDLFDVERRAVASSQDLIILQEKMRVVAARTGIDTSKLLFPDFELGVASEREADGVWNIGPSIAFAFPVFDWGRARRASGLGQLRRLWNQYTALAVELRSAVRVARHRLLNARRQCEYYRRVVLPLAEQITLETQLQYNAMQLGVFQLLQAKQREINIRQRYILAQRDYWIARTELEQILAGRLIQQSALSTAISVDPMVQPDNEGSH